MDEKNEKWIQGWSGSWFVVEKCIHDFGPWFVVEMDTWLWTKDCRWNGWLGKLSQWWSPRGLALASRPNFEALASDIQALALRVKSLALASGHGLGQDLAFSCVWELSKQWIYYMRRKIFACEMHAKVKSTTKQLLINTMSPTSASTHGTHQLTSCCWLAELAADPRIDMAEVCSLFKPPCHM